MASAPIVTSPADNSTQTLPFPVSGTSDGVLVEARDDAGLLLPADQNPAPVIAGAWSMQIQGTTGNRGAAYHVVGGQVSVPAVGVSDDFTQADGELSANWLATGWNWTASATDRPKVVGQRAVPQNANDAWARWAGTPVSDNQRVSCRAGAGTTTVANSYNGPCLVARFQDNSNAIFARSRCKTDLITHEWHFSIKVGGTQVWQAAATTTDLWARIEVVGTTVTFFTSADGVTWTQQATTTQAGLTWSAQPGFWWAGGYSAGGTADTYFIDDFSAESL